MSICAHESFMSMLMKLSRARAREGVTRTTTIGQYAPRVNLELELEKLLGLSTCLLVGGTLFPGPGHRPPTAQGLITVPV